jgi:drug/metabolite transporter (DMT)-like permease
MSEAEHPPSRGAGHSSSQRQRRAYGLLVISILCFATIWPVTKIGLSGATPIWYAAGRMGMGAVVSFALVAATGRLRLPRRVDFPILLSIGVLQFSAFCVFSNLGLRYVPAGRSLVLAYTTILWLVPLAMLVGERIGAWRAAGTLVGLAGIAVLFNPLALDWSDGRVILGNLFLLLAALVWALAIFHARRHPWHLSPLEMLPWQLLLATVLVTVFAAILEPGGTLASTSTALICLIYVGAIAGPIANWAVTTVARDLPLLTTSLGLLVVPVLGLTISAIWLGEAITLSLAAGAILILSGLGLVTVGTVRE